MRSSGFVLAALAAVSQAIQFDFDTTSFAPVAGEAVTLNWSDASGPVTITLVNGPSDDLDDVLVIASGQTSGSFTWTPPSDIPSDTYALAIMDDEDTNYSPQFSYIGEGVASTSATVATTFTTATASGTGYMITMTANSTTTASESSGTDDATTATETDDAATTTESDEDATSTSESDAAETTISSTNDSPRVASSLALVVGSIVAFIFFN